MNCLLSSRSQFSWVTFVGIISLQVTSGTHSIVSAYSSLLQHQFSMSQVQLNFLIVALDIGRLFGWFSIAAANYLPKWMILSIGLIFISVGNGVQYLYLIHKIPSLSYWHVFFLNVIAGNSICWINTYCNIVAIRNFKNNHRTIIALASSYSVFGGKLYTLLVEGIQGREGSRNSSTYLLLSCLVPAVVGLAVVILFSCPKLIEYGELDTFPVVFLIAIATGVYVLLESIAPPFQYMSPRLRVVILVLAILLPLAVLPVINASRICTLKKWRSRVMPEVSSFDSSSNAERVNEVSVISREEEKGGNNEKAGTRVEDSSEEGDTSVGDEHGVKESVMSVNFWLYFWVNACGVTLGMVYAYNLERISESRGNKEASFLLAIPSTFGYFGKVFSVSFDWYTREKRLLSRPAVIVLAMIPMPVSFFLLTSDSNICLYISTCILGICSGAINVISASTTSELFGFQNSKIIHNIVLTNIPIGSLLFGYVAALNYDIKGGGNTGKCIGPACYSKTFIIWGSICYVGTVLSFVLHFRIQKFHSK
uniref:Uncharacterized protein n=1 Tax=Davidia involucrata TaxID=16924 RepID=A0A5B7ANM2_DAVIN